MAAKTLAGERVTTQAPEQEKDLRFHIKIRVYGQGYNTAESHGYLIDDMPMSVSAPVGELLLDVRTMTLTKLRPMLQYNISGFMKKRSLMWQEVLFTFSRMPNMYGRPKEEQNRFQFGFVRKDTLQDVKLIHTSREGEPIATMIGATDFFNHDIVIVPWKLLPPEIEQAPPPTAKATIDIPNKAPRVPSPQRPRGEFETIPTSSSPASPKARAGSSGSAGDSARTASPGRHSNASSPASGGSRSKGSVLGKKGSTR